MKKILAILIALLAALSVQTVAFADGEMMPLQPTATQSEDEQRHCGVSWGLITVDGINYTVLTVPSGREKERLRWVRNHIQRQHHHPCDHRQTAQTYTVTTMATIAFSSVPWPDQRHHSGQRHLHWLRCIFRVH